VLLSINSHSVDRRTNNDVTPLPWLLSGKTSPLNYIPEKKISEKELLSEDNKLEGLPTINLKKILK
jgi:hypothetical protein